MATNDAYDYRFFSLLKKYNIGVGAIMLVIVSTSLEGITTFTSPIISIILALLLFSFVRYQRRNNKLSCNFIPFLCARVLLAYSLVQGLIIAIYVFFGATIELEYFNPTKLQVPYFPVLLFGPIILFHVGLLWFQKGKSVICTLCLLRNGSPSERSASGMVHNKEIKYLGKQLLYLGLIYTAIGWGYFIFQYQSNYVNRLDRFIFSLVPVFIFVVQDIFLSLRCWALTVYWSKKSNSHFSFVKDKTLLRYLVISDNKVLLINKDYNGRTLLDTPISTYIPYHDHKVSIYEATLSLNEIIPENVEVIKFLYSNVDDVNRSAVYHYLCFTNNEGLNNKFNAEWYDMNEIRKKIIEIKVSSALKSEIYRIYTIVMTSKTYDENGKRRYNIRGYKPIFKFDELRDHNFDFENNELMIRSVNNEDNKLLKVGKWWFKYIEGLID